MITQWEVAGDVLNRMEQFYLSGLMKIRLLCAEDGRYQRIEFVLLGGVGVIGEVFRICQNIALIYAISPPRSFWMSYDC
ncbi:hypothetical protein F2Q69_00012517 [Brassica cretica]|uniref:Uncharacterized protein n=1 Tax=Brassica cretica TaxID=69181 RepID=A0A8S9R3R8_BRACR|nr:hypothetical protein F2Q69_00012517 [Brassica cretica]